MNNKNNTCPQCFQAVAYAQGELTPAERERFQEHILHCDVCREEVRSTETLLAALKQLPEREPAHDLVEPVLNQIKLAKPERHWLKYASVAAAVILLLGGGLWMKNLDPRERAANRAAQWLVSAQQSDGRWIGGGQSGANYDSALTGLGLMAGLDFSRTRGMRQSCEKAVRWLADHQAPDGQLGPAFSGSPYNQGIGTLALLKWCSAYPDAAARAAAEKAVKRILACQNPSGGWGYGEGDATPNVSITIWQIQALQKAKALGIADVASAIGKGLRWLRSNRNGQGLYGYRRPDDYPDGSDALTAMSVLCELDGDRKAGQRPDVKQSLNEVRNGVLLGDSPRNYYAAFFVTRVLQQAGDERAEELLGRVQRTLLARQVRSGEQRGSWDTADAYTDVGGSVYATTMAVLALKE